MGRTRNLAQRDFIRNGGAVLGQSGLPECMRSEGVMTVPLCGYII